MSIRARLLWLVAIATLVPALFVGLRFFQDRSAQIDAAVTEVSAAATRLAEDLDQRIQSTAQLLFGLARAQDLDSRDRAACSAFLAAVRETYPQYSAIATIDPDGHVFCTSLPGASSTDLSDRGYVQRARGMTGGVAVEPVIDRQSHSPVLQVAYPARSEPGALRFLVLASLNLAAFSEDQVDTLPPGTEMLLVDRAGTVMAWGPGAARGGLVGSSIAGRPLFQLAAAAGTGEVADADGRARIWAAGTSGQLTATGLRVLVGQSRGALVAAADRRLMQDLSLLAILSLLLFGGVWTFGEIGIRRQVGRFTDMATRLQEGDLAARIPLPHPGGELGGLMTVLNRTAESLQQQRDAIADLNGKLLRSQRMEAIGQLTGGLAHDFNNLLTVIIGSAELLSERLADDPGMQELAETTRLAAERGGELTRSLLAFARRQPLAPRRTDVNAEIRRVEPLLCRSLGEQNECRVVLAPGLPPALVDPAQLEAALLNLMLNARDAMPAGGVLTLETALAEVELDHAAMHEDLRPGSYVLIAVTDSGVGMTPAVLARIFEPFFTTKEFGKGSGLGLSMVYGFVKQSQGHVKVYSEPGQGTVVRLYLPRAVVEDAIPAPPAATTATVGGSERVLVVEDNAMVLTHVVRELTLLGYAVQSAVDGSSALELLRGPGGIDVLFTDVVMPGGMSGPQLAEQARRLRPDLRVLYTSGYTENAVMHDGRLDADVVLLTKPYRRQELAAKLRLVLS